VLLALCSGTLLGGAHFGIISLAGLYYPSAIRANGAGWAAGIAKIGGVFAPMVGAWLLAQGLPIRSAYVFMGICPLVLCISALGIARALRREDAPVARNRPVAAVRGHA